MNTPLGTRGSASGENVSPSGSLCERRNLERDGS